MNKPPQNQSPEFYTLDVIPMLFLSLIMAGGTVDSSTGSCKSAVRTKPGLGFLYHRGFPMFNALNSDPPICLFSKLVFQQPLADDRLPVAIALQLLVIYAPPLRDLFHTVPLSASPMRNRDWSICLNLVWRRFAKAVFPHLFDKGK